MLVIAHEKLYLSCVGDSWWCGGGVIVNVVVNVNVVVIVNVVVNGVIYVNVVINDVIYVNGVVVNDVIYVVTYVVAISIHIHRAINSPNVIVVLLLTQILLVT